MDWKKLQEALWGMPASGDGGFEDLVAQLLSAFMGEPFVIARTGTQRSGDARSVIPGTAIQAKRYQTKTRLPIADISYDIDRVAADSIVDLFVLCATKSADSQLLDEIDRKQEQTGCDVVCIDFPDGDSPPLGCLCVQHWDILQKFPALSTVRQDLQSQALAASGEPETVAKCNALRETLTHSSQTYTVWRKKSLHRLESIFFRDDSPRFSINLDRAVRRAAPHRDLKKWWSSDKCIARVEGEEGTGKSWVAADFTMELARQSTLVFWCYSNDWSDCRSVESLISQIAAAHGVLYADENTRKRFVKKALCRWNQPILIVLDGVNERDGAQFAEGILRDYFQNFQLKTGPKRNLRFLLTTRPLTNYSGFGTYLRHEPLWIPVDVFTEEELALYLERVGVTVNREDIPEPIVELCKIPRYTDLCIHHLKKLPSDYAVTREVLLWLDLVERIERGVDADVREKLGWMNAKDASEVLAKLASEIPADASSFSMGKSILDSIFPRGYGEVRRVLCELRIATNTGVYNATIAREVVVLSWALYILAQIQMATPDEVEALSDNISAHVEPLINSDIKSEAMRTAAILSVLDRSLVGHKDESIATAALLFRWIFLNNIFDVRPTLHLVFRQRVNAYRLFMESFYRIWASGLAEDSLVYPLCECIMSDPGNHDLQDMLERWLLLTWQGDSNTETDSIEWKGEHLPRATSQRQLRLAGIALSVISLNPTPDYLDMLALARATLDASYSYEKEQKNREKTLHRNFGYLLRWGYTNTVLNELTGV